MDRETLFYNIGILYNLYRLWSGAYSLVKVLSYRIDSD